MKNHSSLEISALLLDVIIGCYDFEKTQKQKIEIDIFIKFQNTPKVFVTDQLEDGLDYSILIKLIEHYAEKHFHETVERWCYKIFYLIKTNYHNISYMNIKIKKNPIDIKNLKNGVIFSYEEDLD